MSSLPTSQFPSSDTPPFLAAERHRLIVQRVQELGSVRVAALAKEFRVTEETIRRDLEKLGDEGRLIRIHGGAVHLENDRNEVPFTVRDTVKVGEKRAIAKRAVAFVAEGEVIALDASSSAFEMARLMPDKALTVVTNSLAIAQVLSEKPNIRTIGSGGVLDTPSLSFVGSLAEAALERFHIRKVFFSCQGIDLDRGLCVTADEHGRVKRKMIDAADMVFALVDGSKFGAKGVEFFARCSEIDVLITDPSAPPDQLSRLQDMGVRIEIAV